MNDVEYCEGFVKARTVRDDAVLPLLHRAIPLLHRARKESKVAFGDLLVENKPCFAAQVESPRDYSDPKAPTFTIKAEVTFDEERQQLCHSVKCQHVNANPTAAPEYRAKEISSSPKFDHPIATFDLDQIRRWYGGQLSDCAARVQRKLEEYGS